MSALLSYFKTPTKKDNQTASLTSATHVKAPFERLSQLSQDFDPSQCVVTPLPMEVRTWHNKSKPQFAIVIENVLSEEECKKWIEDTENKGYELALVNVGGGKQKLMTDVRNSARCIVDDEERMEELWKRVEPFIPKDLYADRHVFPSGLNERFRFLRYHAGEYFAPHCDGAFIYPSDHPTRAGQCSELTFLLYLNDLENPETAGGQTRFFTDWSEKTYYDVVPRRGSVLLFEHKMFHEGVCLGAGEKYALRTDVMYLCTDPKMQPW